MKRSDNEFIAVRKNFPVTRKKSGVIYFNAASIGPLSLPVRKMLDEYYDYTYLQNRGIDGKAFDSLDNIRRIGASLIGARQDEVGFGFNTGYGLNIAAFGLPLKKGDEVLLSDIEFPSNVYPWMALKERGIRVKLIKSSDGKFDIDQFEKAIGPKSKVLSLSFVQFFNGFKNDLKQIGAICKKHEMFFVVDGIQGCGVETINVKKCQIDIFSAGAQKWLLSPMGTGLYFIKKELQSKLRMPWASWLSVPWDIKFGDLFHFEKEFFDSARKFEMGTYPYAHVFAFEEALKLFGSLGVRNIQRHNHQLIDILIDFLNDSQKYRIVSSLEKKHRSSILSFTCDNARAVHRHLVKNGIICSFREGAIRVSVHLYNNKSDLASLIKALKQAK